MSQGPDPTDIYRAQTSMLRWLQRLGHAVDLSNDPAVAEEIFVCDPPMKRFNGRPCPYCLNQMRVGTERFPTKEHVRPRRAGGTHANGNVIVACSPCNNDKGDMMLSEFVVWLEKRNDPRAVIVRAVDPNIGIPK